jgi:multidrug efflux system membrane fusion protein
MDEGILKQLPNDSAGDEKADPASTVSSVRPATRSKKRTRIVQVVSLLFLAIILVGLWRFLSDRAAPKAASTGRGEVVPVEMAPVTQKDVPIQIRSIGNVEALTTIVVRSQVDGTIQRVTFTPGQEVKKNDPLFTIDPRPLQAALNSADANLLKAIASVRQGEDIVAKDQATAANDKVIADRDANLVEQGVIPREQYDNDFSKWKADAAAVRADQSSVANLQAAQKAEQANVDNARVQLSYATIRAPISGRTGSLAVTGGNLVRANDTAAMVTITQTAPIYVTFSVPEQDLQRIRQYAGASSLSASVVIPGDDANPAQGRLSLVDNTVDVTTGTVRLKATFENGDRRLYPGQFVNVVLTLGTESQALLVPSQAVQVGQDKSFVYVVKPDMTAEVRTVKPGAQVDNMTVIDDGLKPGEQVVTDGQLRLVPGSKVQSKAAQGQSQGQGQANQNSKGGTSQGGN